MPGAPASRASGAPRAAAPLLLLAVLAAYASALPGDFVWLDHVEIVHGGYRVTDPGDTALLFTQSLDAYLGRNQPPRHIVGGYWRPLYGLSISLDWSLWGARPSLFHAENLAWHAAVVLLLYALGRRLFAHLPRGGEIAFFAALLFAVHPLGVSSVTRISGRIDPMCAAASAGALLCFLRGQAQRARGERALAPFAGAAALMVLAILSKELGALVAPAATLLWWTLPDARRDPHGRGWRAAPLFGLAALWGEALAALAYRVAVLEMGGLAAPYPAEGFLPNVATMATLLWDYLGRVWLPRSPRLSDSWPIVAELGTREWLAVAALGAALAGGAVLALRRHALAPALVWLGLYLLPASGLVPLRHLRAERYLYPASWGALAVLCVLLLHVAGARLGDRFRRAARAGLVTLALVCAAITAVANLAWWSDESLFADAVARDPDYVEGHMGLALQALGQGEHEQAAAHSRAAIRAASDPTRSHYWNPYVAYLNLGLALEALERPAPALRAFRDALRYRPQDPEAHCRAGRAARALGRLPLARAHLVRALRAAPRRADCTALLGAVLVEHGDFESAARVLEPLVRRLPRQPDPAAHLGRAWLELGRVDEAEPLLRRLVEAAPRRADARALWAWALARRGQTAQAALHLTQAQSQAPDDPAVRRAVEAVGPSLAPDWFE